MRSVSRTERRSLWATPDSLPRSSGTESNAPAVPALPDRVGPSSGCPRRLVSSPSEAKVQSKSPRTPHTPAHPPRSRAGEKMEPRVSDMSRPSLASERSTAQTVTTAPERPPTDPLVPSGCQSNPALYATQPRAFLPPTSRDFAKEQRTHSQVWGRVMRACSWRCVRKMEERRECKENPRRPSPDRVRGDDCRLRFRYELRPVRRAPSHPT